MELLALFCRGEFIAFVLLYVIWRFSRSRLRIGDISNRHVFITGCDSGFGRLLAERLHQHGVHVYAGCMLSSTVKELSEKYNYKMKPVLLDVTNSESVREARDFVSGQLNGRALWAVVNNAGIGGTIFLPFEWTSKEDCQKVLDVNLLGMYDVTLSFLPLIKHGSKGRVVNMSSAFGRVVHHLSGYTLSKHAVEAFSDGLSIELHPYNISVHTLEPGFFRTDIIPDPKTISVKARNRWAELDSKIKERHGEEFLEKMIAYSMENNMKRSVSKNVGLVVDAYEHAILAKYPKNRYQVGNDMKFIFFPLSWLPFPYQFDIMRLLDRWRGFEKPLPNDAATRKI